jgi:GxxExxY protein
MIQGNTAIAFKPITDRERWLTGEIVGTAIAVHKALGPGLQETVYEQCFCHELTKRNIPFIKQYPVSITYKDIMIDDGLHVDILVDNLIIIELKAQDNQHPVWEAQLLSYLKLSGKRLGYILNFHCPLMKDGIKRMINN